MTIRITDGFALRRDGHRVVATIDGVINIHFSAKQARDAAEAFNIMAVMLEASGDDSDKDESESEEKEAA